MATKHEVMKYIWDYIPAKNLALDIMSKKPPFY
jgi:chromatin remodeling complex protein RSC6